MSVNLESVCILSTRGAPLYLQVDRQSAVSKGVEVDLQDLEAHLSEGGECEGREGSGRGGSRGDSWLAHVVVVELAVAQRHVDVEREVLAVLEEQALIDVGRLLMIKTRAGGR